MQENLRVAEKHPITKPRALNPIVNRPEARAMFVFSRSWSRAVAARPGKPSGAKSPGRS